MKTTSTQKIRPPAQSAKVVDRKYDSVTDLIRREEVPQKVQHALRRLAEETKISLRLAELRQAAGKTQAEMAKALGFETQSAVSKLESERDENITLRVIREYSRVCDQRIGLLFGKPFTPTEAIQDHVEGLKYRLNELAEIANLNPDRRNEMKAQLGEAFCNLLNIIIQWLR